MRYICYTADFGVFFMTEPIAFLSYAHFDDDHDGGIVTRLFHERLSKEVQAQTGHPFPIFLDNTSIQWGQRWEERIDGGLDGAVFLIAIVTPSYFRSDYCREEYDKFLEQEQKLGRNDLILPVYYVECDEVEEKSVRESNPWAWNLYKRQYADWRELRHEAAPNIINRALEKLAKQIKQSLKRQSAVVTPASMTVNDKTISSTKQAPTALAKERAVLRLRSKPLTTKAEDDFKALFNLDENLRPLTYIQNDYERKGDVVVDHATGLTWQQAGSEEYVTYEKAFAYMKEQNAKGFGGFNDWRLPTVEELASLLESEKQAHDLYIHPVFNDKQRWCWTSDKYGSSGACRIGFNLGVVSRDYLDGDFYVRLVRP